MDVLTPILKYIVSNSKIPFDELVTKLVEYVDRPVHSIQEMRLNRSTKVKGDLFELFCVVYLRHQGYNVWLLHLWIFKTPISRNKKIQISNGEFHALPDLSPLRGFVGICSSPRKHFGRPLPLFSSCNNSKMFFDAFTSLSIQHNVHSLELQRITL